ncbi:ankyrin repeat protein [Colletotrichum kahawae]|uniref:Ankyrin repeat protein n=1 Tax=Colletotrichum kahawae TaxID=34407 RepID=A0AAE0D6Q9_COLKA|nr:ankyrin repeat protein [Colletotrichum kahawae]
MLDEIHEDIQVSKALNDCNTYTLGSVGKHNVVVACLPKGQMGTVSAATVATRMISTFPSVKIGLLVGIGGGVPPTVRLGDVVVSTPTTNFPGVVQWDFAVSRQVGGLLSTPIRLNSVVLPLSIDLVFPISKLESLHALRGSQHLDEMGERWPRLLPRYARSAILHRDFLFSASYCHVGEKLEDASAQGSGFKDDHILSSPTTTSLACRSCDPKKAEERNHEGEIQIHYGLIASGNQVIKDALSRDRLNKQLGGNVMCIEMEAAGLMPDFPCLVIRGICDYADSHKNDLWQEYAAATASAFAKELLSHVYSSDVHKEKSIQRMIQDGWFTNSTDMVTLLTEIVVKSTMSNMQEDVHSLVTRFNQDEDSPALEWLKGLTPIDYGSQQSDFLRTRQHGTGEWFIGSEEYCAWVATAGQTLFCPGIPGAGKTIMSSIVIDDLGKRFRSGYDDVVGVAHVFCNYKRTEHQRLEDLLATLLKQLALERTNLPKYIASLHGKHRNKGTKPSSGDLVEVLEVMCASFTRAFVVVDAMDECQAEGCRSALIDVLFDLQRKFPNAVSLFITSRYVPEVKEKFQSSLQLEIHATDGDLSRYAHSRIDHILTWICVPKEHRLQIRKEITEKITKIAGGM